jgi:hypothetical protein
MEPAGRKFQMKALAVSAYPGLDRVNDELPERHTSVK